MTEPYLEPRQSALHPPTEFENALGDAIETAYAAGTHDLDGLIAHLNEHGPDPTEGSTWTPEGFLHLMAELGR